MSFVQAGETTRVEFHGYPVWCGSLLPCAALLTGFPPPAQTTTQVALRAGKSIFGSAWLDDGYLIFHPNITHTGIWLPSQCRGQCVTMNLTLGIPILPVPTPPPPHPPIRLVLSPLPLTLVWNITTATSTRVTATFTGSFARLRDQVIADTVTVTDGFLDAQTSP